MSATPASHEHLDDEVTIRGRRSDTYNRLFPNPLTDAQRRFWTARDSGYTGWLDQDGNRAIGPNLH
jgi:hypothetical protein